MHFRSTLTWLTAILWVAVVATTSVDAQIGGRATRPQVKPPQGPVRAIIFKNCTSCHGIDDYAFNALDREGWNRHLEAKHPDGFAKLITDQDREALLSRACSTCHPIDRVNSARNSADAWRVLTIDMRERGARLTDEEVEKL